MFKKSSHNGEGNGRSTNLRCTVSRFRLTDLHQSWRVRIVMKGCEKRRVRHQGTGHRCHGLKGLARLGRGCKTIDNFVCVTSLPLSFSETRRFIGWQLIIESSVNLLRVYL